MIVCLVPCVSKTLSHLICIDQFHAFYFLVIWLLFSSYICFNFFFVQLTKEAKQSQNSVPMST